MKRKEKRQRVTSRRAGLETDSAGGLRQHKDGRGLGGEASTLSLPWREGGGDTRSEGGVNKEREKLKLQTQGRSFGTPRERKAEALVRLP